MLGPAVAVSEHQSALSTLQFFVLAWHWDEKPVFAADPGNSSFLGADICHQAAAEAAETDGLAETARPDLGEGLLLGAADLAVAERDVAACQCVV